MQYLTCDNKDPFTCASSSTVSKQNHHDNLGDSKLGQD